MRVLLVSHDFLPNHPSGTEIYACQLGKHLRARGHEVHVFTTEKDVGRPNLRLDRREYEGLVVHELVQNLFYDTFRQTWDYPAVEEPFGRLLDELKPDVVHFHHLLYLSVGCVDAASKRGLPAVYTLHDYWLQCPRFGQRIHADRSVCHTIDFGRCGECLTSFKYRQTAIERTTAKAIAVLNRATGIDVSSAARRVGNLFRGRREPGVPDPDAARAMEREVRTRDRELRERLFAGVHRFIAPSRFLERNFVEWGLPAERMVFWRCGIDLEPFADFRREPSDEVRVAFIGTLARHKAPHVVLDAWERLEPDLRAKGTLTIHGPKSHNPDYLRELEAQASRCGAVLAGRLERKAVPEALARTDLLVVPSVWYENGPLIIYEAMATRTPLAVSDLGGMAELVDEGRNGWRFPAGDAAKLAEILARILRDPTELAALYPAGSQVKSVAEDAEWTERLYEEAIGEAKRVG